MSIEHSKNFEKKTSLNIQKTFQCNDFHNIFELTTGTNKVENHFSNMEWLINEDMYDVAMPIWVMKIVQHSSFARGYHVYINIWEPLVGKCLKSRKESTNEMDKTAVAVIRINFYSEKVVVGHVPKNMSKIYVPIPAQLCLGHLCNQLQINHQPINRGGGYGLEIPANLYFHGPEKLINWLKNKINKTEEKLKENVKHCLK